MISFHSGSHVDVQVTEGKVRVSVTIIPANSAPLTQHREFALKDLPNEFEDRVLYLLPLIREISNEPIANHLVNDAVAKLNKELYDRGIEQ